MVKMQKPVNLTLTPAIAMAAYTTYKITMASINLARRKKASSSLVRLLRVISFIDALVSILTLQNTLISVNNSDTDLSMLPLTATSSGVIWFVILLISISACLKGWKNLSHK